MSEELNPYNYNKYDELFKDKNTTEVKNYMFNKMNKRMQFIKRNKRNLFPIRYYTTNLPKSIDYNILIDRERDEFIYQVSVKNRSMKMIDLLNKTIDRGNLSFYVVFYIVKLILNEKRGGGFNENERDRTVISTEQINNITEWAQNSDIEGKTIYFDFFFSIFGYGDYISGILEEQDNLGIHTLKTLIKICNILFNTDTEITDKMRKDEVKKLITYKGKLNDFLDCNKTVNAIINYFYLPRAKGSKICYTYTKGDIFNVNKRINTIFGNKSGMNNVLRRVNIETTSDRRAFHLLVSLLNQSYIEFACGGLRKLNLIKQMFENLKRNNIDTYIIFPKINSDLYSEYFENVIHRTFNLSRRNIIDNFSYSSVITNKNIEKMFYKNYENYLVKTGQLKERERRNSSSSTNSSVTLKSHRNSRSNNFPNNFSITSDKMIDIKNEEKNYDLYVQDLLTSFLNANNREIQEIKAGFKALGQMKISILGHISDLYNSLRENNLPKGEMDLLQAKEAYKNMRRAYLHIKSFSEIAKNSDLKNKLVHAANDQMKVTKKYIDNAIKALSNKSSGLFGGSKIKSIGSRIDVWNNRARKTSGGLMKKDLMINKEGKIISRRLHKRGIALSKSRKSKK